MRWVAIINPQAGRGHNRRLQTSLKDALKAQSIETVVTSSANAGIVAARQALSRGAGIIACGGDGTIGEIAAQVAAVKGTLAIIPTGSGNDFARHLGLNTRHPLANLDLLNSGATRLVDLGLIQFADGSKKVFTTVAHWGFDGAANKWANDVTVISGTALYILAMLRTLISYRPQPARVVVGDKDWHGLAWLVAIGNTRNYAGGMVITPGAEIDDGQLEVCVIGASSRWRLITKFPSVFRGAHTRFPEVTSLQGASVEISGEGQLWANGELAGLLPATVSIRPHELAVIVPTT